MDHTPWEKSKKKTINNLPVSRISLDIDNFKNNKENNDQNKQIKIKTSLDVGYLGVEQKLVSNLSKYGNELEKLRYTETFKEIKNISSDINLDAFSNLFRPISFQNGSYLFVQRF